jgi:hypothetical protein
MSIWTRLLQDVDPLVDSLYNNGTNATDYNTPYYDTAAGYAEKEYEPVNYTVVSVGIMTLGLIVVVELVRHQLDQAAMGRPFYKTVLEGVYSECKYILVAAYDVW